VVGELDEPQTDPDRAGPGFHDPAEGQGCLPRVPEPLRICL